MSIFTIDIGGTFVKYGVWHHGKIQEGNKFPTPKTWTELVQTCKSLLTNFQKKYTIEGVAVSAPGAVDSKNGVIRGISAVPYIHHIEFKKELEDTLGVPVEIENDANCAALAENWLGAAKGYERTLFVVLGTGVGGAILHKGNLDTGANLFGGEFGLMVLDQGKTFSNLGTVVSMEKRFSKGKARNYSGEEIFKLAEVKQDEEAQKAINDFYHYLSLGIYNLLSSYNPDRIVIGGGVSAKEGFIRTLNEKVKEKLKHYGVADIHCDIVACHFHNNSNLIGAASLFNT